MPNSFVQSAWTRKDQQLEQTLRPKSLREFVGQSRAREKLEIFVGAAKKRQEALGHALFYGPPGLGKTTLAHIISHELQSDLTVLSGPSIEKPSDLAGILTNLKERDILFIDEIHRLNKTVEEYLYPAMEDFTLDLLLDDGPQARSMRIPLKRFSLIGATTRMGLLSAPLRSRFLFICRMHYYEPPHLSEILTRSAHLLQVDVDPDSVSEVANRSRGTPRTANNLLRWVRDYSQMRTNSQLDKIATRAALEMLEIDCLGLDDTDTRILKYLIETHGGGPVGVNTIAAALGEDVSTLEEVHEPFLMMKGMIKRSQRGREVTKFAYHHLGLS